MKSVGAWVLLGVGAAIGATDPAADGPFAAAKLAVGIPGTQGATLQTDLYFPGTTAADLAEGRVTYDAVAPLSLALALEGGAPALHVGGPSGQSFDVQYSTNGAAWNAANWTGAAPALVTNLPSAGRLLWLRTRSLPE